MAKSVNDYYLEKMNKLLEMQQQNTASAPKAAPLQAPASKSDARKQPPRDGRDYYDKFRTKARAEEQIRSRQEKEYIPPRVNVNPAPGAKQETKGQENQKNAQGNGVSPNKNGAKEQRRQRPNPEQTQKDREREAEKRGEAIEKARRAKKLRKIRDAVISFVLILAVFSVMCVVVYRLIFVVSDIKVNGNKSYSAEEIADASGVDNGDHLYSFRGSEAEKSIMLNCPMVSDVKVDRVAPKTVNLNITEENKVFYCNFYGEYRAMSESLRILGSIAESDAKEDGLVKIKLPPVKRAVAGKVCQFSTLESDKYLYEFCTALAESPLWERVSAVDLTSKYDIRLVCDGKYLFYVGDITHMDTKLRIGATVLEDETLKAMEKATVDLRDLSKTSVVEDSRLELEW